MTTNGWLPIESAPKPPMPSEFEIVDQKTISVLFAFPNGTVKEGYCKWVDDYNTEDFACRLAYWLANNSCSCCYYDLPKKDYPTHWQPLPQPPEAIMTQSAEAKMKDEYIKLKQSHDRLLKAVKQLMYDADLYSLGFDTADIALDAIKQAEEIL